MVLENDEKETSLKPKIVYHPQRKNNHIEIFTEFIEKKYEIKLGDYWKLHEWSCKNFPEFWDSIWQFYDVIYSVPHIEVFDRSRRSFHNMEWFHGARLNFAENALKYRDSRIAIIAADASDNMEYITYKQLYEEVCQYSKALKNSGLKQGDVVACYMANKKEAIFAFLAIASLGAIWVGALPILGSKIVISRFLQTSPKVMFTAGNFIFGGKEIKMLDKIKEITSELPTLEKVIFVPSKNSDVTEDNQNIPKCCTITEFLHEVRDEYRSTPWDLEFAQLKFDHPLTISFTSGTTDLPKGIVHSTGAFLSSLSDFGLHQDITRDDVLINFSPVGWISWNMHVNCLPIGMTLCLYDGYPFEESPTRFWDLVDKARITSAGIWTSSAEYVEKNGHLPTQNHSLKSLKQIFLLGSVVKPHTFDFLSKLKPGLFFASNYGATEVFSMISGFHSNMPVYRGEIQCFSLAMDIKCLDKKGNKLIGERGDLVIGNPYPSMPVTLLHDEDKEKFREIYLDRFPGNWFVGDDVWINPETKGFILYGRSDETLNPKGARFSCSEIYFALEAFPDILDAVCVSQFNEQRDERVVLFVKMKSENELTETVREDIRQAIESTLTCEHVPDIIMQVPDIPYNMTGKKMNILVKQLVNKMPVLNGEIVVNPESVEFFSKLDLGEF